MLRVFDDFRGFSRFNQLALLHDEDSIAEGLDYTKIVRNEEKGQFAVISNGRE